MKFAVWYMYNDQWDVYSNDGKGYSFKEAQEVAVQLSENGMVSRVKVTEIEGTEGR